MPILLVLLALQGSDREHKKLYEKVRGSVVAIRAMAPLGERSGTGTVIDKDGLILTSYSVCPEGSKNVRVWTAGPRMYKAEIVGTSKRDEVALLRIKPKDPLPPIAFGESGKVKTGEISYTIGNAANSIILDDSPSLNVGVISGQYTLTEPRANSTYAGIVLETTAAVNVGMEGAPLLNAEGKMIGFVTLNYSPHRFLGAAIPIDSQKYVIEILLKKESDKTAPVETGEGTLGVKAEDRAGRIVVTEVVREGAADRAGIRPGDTILGIGKTRIQNCEELWRRLKDMKAGDIVWLTIEADGDSYQVKVTLTGKK
jgi:S1-C subfamily serine protease